MEYYKTEGVVLKKRDFQEADKIITLYTKEYGKINCIAKGVKRITSRISARVEIFTHSYFLIAPGKNLYLIIDAEIINSNRCLKERLDLFLISSSIVEVLEKTQPEGEANKKIFSLLISAFNSLSKSNFPVSVLRIFQANLIKISGYTPQLSKCVKCGTSSGNFKFSNELGGIICKSCSYFNHSIDLNREELLLLRKIFSRNSLLSFKIEEKLDRRIQTLLKYFLEEKYGVEFECDIYHIRNLNNW